jgi:hypothetical protein
MSYPPIRSDAEIVLGVVSCLSRNGYMGIQQLDDRTFDLFGNRLAVITNSASLNSWLKGHKFFDLCPKNGVKLSMSPGDIKDVVSKGVSHRGRSEAWYRNASDDKSPAQTRPWQGPPGGAPTSMPKQQTPMPILTHKQPPPIARAMHQIKKMPIPIIRTMPYSSYTEAEDQALVSAYELELDKRIPATPEDTLSFCEACGAQHRKIKAKFCHACGVKHAT